MAKRANDRFVVQIDPKMKLSGRQRGSVAAAIGGAAAAELARLDLGGTVAFIPRIDWPGGRIIDLGRYLKPDQLKELEGGPGF